MSEQNKALVKTVYDVVVNGRDLDAISQYVADEQLVEQIHRGCFSMFQSFPDLHGSIEEMVAEGDKVSVRATSTGTHDGEFAGIPSTGRNIAFETAEIYRIADGMIVGYWCLPDLSGLMRQLTQDAPVGAGA